jgi:hypothetical protein
VVRPRAAESVPARPVGGSVGGRSVPSRTVGASACALASGTHAPLPGTAESNGEGVPPV